MAAAGLACIAPAAAAHVVYLEPAPLPESGAAPQEIAPAPGVVRGVEDAAWKMAGDAGFTKRVQTQQAADALFAHAALIGDQANVRQLFDFRLPAGAPQPSAQGARRPRTWMDLILPPAIPEPSAWLLFLTGFFAVAAGLRRRAVTGAPSA